MVHAVARCVHRTKPVRLNGRTTLHKCVCRNDSRIKRTNAAAALLFIAVAASSALTVIPWSIIQTVFVIVLENYYWSDIKGYSSADYIYFLVILLVFAYRYF